MAILNPESLVHNDDYEEPYDYFESLSWKRRLDLVARSSDPHTSLSFICVFFIRKVQVGHRK
jgi:hypothetical protein